MLQLGPNQFRHADASSEGLLPKLLVKPLGQEDGGPFHSDIITYICLSNLRSRSLSFR